MSITEKIKIILIKKKMQQNELAELLGTTKQNLNQKLRRDDFSISEIVKIADALNCDLNITFKLRDTEEII